MDETIVFNLTVMDGGEPRLASHAIVTVTVVDINDHVPVFVDPSPACLLAENATVGTQCIVMAATDGDPKGLPSSRLSYALLGDSPFSISPVTGAIATTERLDREAAAHYAVVVQVSDAGQPPLASNVTLAVAIGDINDNAPLFNDSAYACVVPEDDASNPEVVGGTVPRKVACVTVFASDADAGTNALVTYSLAASEGDGESPLLFAIDGIGGNLSALISSALPRFDREAKAKYLFEVVATDHGMPPLSRRVNVTVTIADVNDNTPNFTQPVFACAVAEHQVGASCPAVMATDADELGSDNARIAYSLEDNRDGLFHINATSGILSVTSDKLDREATPTVSLRVVATDGGGKTASAELAVAVEDINDNAPVFAAPAYSCRVSEAAVPGNFTCVVVQATDADAAPASAVTYNMAQGSDPASPWAVDGTSGAVILAAGLDREAVAAYNVTVVATDAGTPAARSTAVVVSISVLDENDRRPQFGADAYTCTVVEETGVAQRCDLGRGGPLATDGDLAGTPAATIRYSFAVAPQPPALFAINASTGAVTTTGRFDREEEASYTLVIVAMDGGEPPLAANTTVTVSVGDVNDHTPQFIAPAFQCNLAEDVATGTPCTRALALDRDDPTTPNGRLRYTLGGGGNAAGHFTVDQATGQVATAAALDRESTAAYNLTVTVSDGGARTASAAVIVTVLDVNDNAPEFEQPGGYACRVMENIKRKERREVGGGASCTQVKARDADEAGSENARVTYSLIDVEDAFVIDAVTGEVSNALALDREAKATYNVQVVATDHGSPPQRTVVPLVVTVLDQNDNTPVFGADSYACTLLEGSLPGAACVTVAASDADEPGSLNAAVTYSVQSDSRLFVIDAASGAITLDGQLDREAFGTATLQVTATDLGTPPRFATVLVIVTVADSNDNRPVFERPAYTCNLTETAGPVAATPDGVRLPCVRVFATDADQPGTPFGSVAYSLAGAGADAGLFAIDAATGAVVTLTSAFDREQLATYHLTVTAADGGGASSSVPLTVAITDVNDHAPSVTSGGGALAATKVVPENLALASVILPIRATDADAGANGLVTFRIASGNDYGNFAVDAATGDLSLLSTLDHRLVASHLVVVRVQDGGVPAQSTEVVVTVVVQPFLSGNSSAAVTVNWELSFARPDDFIRHELWRREPVDCGTDYGARSDCDTRQQKIISTSRVTGVTDRGLKAATIYEYQLRIFSLSQPATLTPWFAHSTAESSA